jgi:hypothetical protein
MGHRRSVSLVGRGRGGSGERAHRRPAAVAAAAAPERRVSGREEQQAIGVASRGLAEVEKGLLGLGIGSQPELAAAGCKDAGGRRGRRWGGLRVAGKASVAFIGAGRTP